MLRGHDVGIIILQGHTSDIQTCSCDYGNPIFLPSYPDDIYPGTLKHVVRDISRDLFLLDQDPRVQGDLRICARSFAFGRLTRVDDHDAVDDLKRIN
jgi:hypothetical protein